MSEDNSSQFRKVVFEACRRAEIKFDPDNIHEWQIEALQSCIKQNTTLVAVPTGGGKSLIFQLAPIVNSIILKKPQFVLIVSPLRALIKNQTEIFISEKCIRLEKI
jgi:superfamily II DNA helicase RecQ